MEALANDIQQFTDGFKETEESRERRNELRRRIKEIVNENHPDANVVIVGSCGNGFGIMFSDLDLTVILSSRISFRSSIHQLLLKIEKGLKRDSSSYTDIEVVSHATVPIITFKYRCEAETLSCDVSVNTRNNIFNGVLLKAYSQLDGRVKPLMLVLKHWAKECGVIQSRYNRLSSFTFALMVIHYLQSGCHPIVLPSLQNTRQAFFNTSNDNVDAITRYINDPLPQTILSFK